MGNCVLLVLALLFGCSTSVDKNRNAIGYRLDTKIDAASMSKSEVYMETQHMIVKHGYPAETHVVHTADGYVLTLHRIPRGRRTVDNDVGAPVLLMHGIFGASDTWIMIGPEKALGFVLADEGYDVWLGNARGNYYSRKHETLEPRDPKFWNFTWHEMGNLDLPAVIDYILGVTKQEQLFYVGHSMGNTMFFVLTSTRPEYNEKIRLMVALAPVSLNGHLRTAFKEFYLPYSRSLVGGFVRTGQLEVLPRLKNDQLLFETVCPDGRLTQELCVQAYFGVFGANRKQLNATLLPVIWSHILSGSSINTLDHYVENNKQNSFQWYDHTRQRRKMPAYDLTLVTTPVSLHYAMNDALLNPDAVLQLAKSLPNVVQMVKLSDEEANHMDFVMAKDVKTLIYDNVLAIMKKY